MSNIRTILQDSLRSNLPFALLENMALGIDKEDDQFQRALSGSMPRSTNDRKLDQLYNFYFPHGILASLPAQLVVNTKPQGTDLARVVYNQGLFFAENLDIHYGLSHFYIRHINRSGGGLDTVVEFFFDDLQTNEVSPKSHFIRLGVDLTDAWQIKSIAWALMGAFLSRPTMQKDAKLVFQDKKGQRTFEAALIVDEITQALRDPLTETFISVDDIVFKRHLPQGRGEHTVRWLPVFEYNDVE